MGASQKRKFWGWFLAVGSFIAAGIGGFKLYGKEKSHNFFGDSGSVTFHIRNSSATQKNVSIFNQTAIVPPEITVTGGDYGNFTRSIGITPVKLISIMLKSNNYNQLDIPINLTYKDMGGDILTQSFTPETSDMQNKDNIARVNFNNAVLDSSAQLDYTLVPNANVSFTIVYEKIKP